MDSLVDLVKDKLVEGEFDPPEPTAKGRFNYILDELKHIDKQMCAIDHEAARVTERIRKMAKNHCDDMTIVDTTKVGSMRDNAPWHSSNEFTRSKYRHWSFTPIHIAVGGPRILEVAIRHESSDASAVREVGRLCLRLQTLEDRQAQLTRRHVTLRHELTGAYGSMGEKAFNRLGIKKRIQPL